MGGLSAEEMDKRNKEHAAALVAHQQQQVLFFKIETVFGVYKYKNFETDVNMFQQSKKELISTKQISFNKAKILISTKQKSFNKAKNFDFNKANNFAFLQAKTESRIFFASFQNNHFFANIIECFNLFSFR